MIEPTVLELQEGAMLRDLGSGTGTRKMAARRLNALGEINAHCVHANDPDRMERLAAVAHLGATMQKLKNDQAVDAEAAAQKRRKEAASKAVDGVQKLRKGMAPDKLFAKELEGVITISMGAEIPRGEWPKNKQQWVDYYFAKVEETGLTVPESYSAGSAPAAESSEKLKVKNKF